MGLFKGKHKKKPAGSLASERTVESRDRIRGWLGKKGREVQTDAGPIASSAADCQDQLEQCERDSQASVAACDPLKDREKLDTVQSLWDRAYDALKAEDPRLVENYEKLLSSELSKTSSGLNDSNSDPLDQTEESLDDTDNQINEANLQERRAQLDIIIQGGLQRMDEKKVKYHFAGNEYVLQNQIAQAAKLVQWAKDWIGDAVKDSPQASMAWAGVCLILPLLTKPSAADQANRDGFSYVTTRMRYYVALEPLLLPKNHNIERAIVPKKLTAEFEIHIMDLYQHILDFQIRSVLRFYRSRLGNLKGDILSNEDWIQMQSTINNLETIVRNDSKQINSLSSIRELENLNKNARGSLETMQQLLSVAQKQLRVNQEHLQVSSKLLHVSKQQLQVQKQIAKKTLSQEEEKCHQLFRLTKDEKDDTYEWYKNRVEDRVENTCQWFLDHQNFKKWLEQESGPLLVSADPGCGKSVLAKYLIDCGLPRSATICYFFFKDQDQNTLKQALCALLHQLFSYKPSLIRHAMPEYSINGPNLVNITTSLWDILEKVGQDTETGPVIFVLDALDECTESDFRDLIRRLKRQFHKVGSGLDKVRFLLTSRPYGHIVCEFQELIDAFPYIHIPGEDESETISQEVNCVIKYRVNQLAKEKNLPANIRGHLEQRLLKIHHRTYLWVYLVFDYLKSQHFKKTEKGIESPITILPESVNQAYEAILSRSKNDQMVRKALCIILAASRPLTLAEMNIAININISSKSMEDLDLEKEEDFKVTLRTWCGLFVSVYDSKVYFLHQTAREFLLQKLSSSAPIPIQSLHWHRSISAQQAHSVLAEICIIYLDVLLSCANPEIDQYNNNHIFLDYSAKSWAAHFREAHIRNDAAIISSVLRICDPTLKNCSTWFKIYWKTQDTYRPPSLSALMIVSYLGLEGVVKLLLETGNVEADAMDKYGQTPLSLAAASGHEAVVKLLLETGDVEADAMDEYGRTPLLYAAVSGHEAVIKLLLETGNVEADAKNNYGRTPLSRAAENGHEAVVKLLLETGDIEADAIDNDGRTPLWWAAENGHEAVVKLLLETGNVEADAMDKYGQTPLWWAARKGHEAVVKLLLETGDVKADAMDNNGWTPLWCAAREGHEAVVKLLLETGDVKADAIDNDGRTPLWWAAENGHEAVVKLLLETGNVEADAKGKYGRTPLWCAADSGHMAVAKLLLETGNAKADVKDNDGRTLLWWAAERGHDAVVKLLLETGNVEADVKDKYGQTPLWWAAREGHEAVAELLLETGDVKADAIDNDGRTPLWWAAQGGHEAVVKLLLETGDVKADVKDKYGQTPLWCAAESGHEAVVKLLLETGDVEADVMDNDGRTPLSRAAERGHEGVVKLLQP